ncbi:PEP-CTERM sorting domain-containing protein [Azohydromonas lata]|uniref:PEP-CTERM sorting domain-containing protein n=1 Tax=Azohydromonas lata TaxID=45677 RepID=A0ABU5IF40_9BURK|nr:PEP-CTERM sorting domain-containing protein [Azohydromonas lata]MDZ5457742.1 PEP-CTERM sorting domain-containing protein [Azohydromonas lata]
MKKIAAALAAVALCAGAQAATVSDSFTNTLQHTDFTNQTGTLDLFNTALGTLTGVSLTLYGQSVTDLVLTNTSNSVSEASASTRTRLTFSSSIGALSSLIGGSYKIQLLPTTDDTTLNPGQSATFNDVSDNSSYVVTGLNAILSAFNSSAGHNTFTISCSSATRLLTSVSGGNSDATQNTEAGCGASVVYTYTAAPTPHPTPEPASLALVGLGLAGVGVARRKAKRA